MAQAFTRAAPSPGVGHQIRRLGAERDKGHKRLGDAAMVLLVERLDKAGYDEAKDAIEQDLRAAEAGMERLRERAARPTAEPPSFGELLGVAHGWDIRIK